MKLKSVQIKGFKRFTDLRVEGIPPSARLLMLVGPNGCGKSSFIEALNQWHRSRSGFRIEHKHTDLYWAKAGVCSTFDRKSGVNVTVHGEDGTDIEDYSPAETSLYVRSAYRNEPNVMEDGFRQQGTIIEQLKGYPLDMISDDKSVSRNYRILLGALVEAIKEGVVRDRKARECQNEVIGELHKHMLHLFGDLKFEGFGNPGKDNTFFFSKGVCTKFAYLNLSAGEKAAFDLIVDLINAKVEFFDTLYCIDEPELHMHAKMQADLLSVLEELIPQDCQLMLASHSIGMMRRALEIHNDRRGEVFFLDFGDHDFDGSVVITPTEPNRPFWKKIYSVALDDLASLVAPERIVICEGEPEGSSAPDNYDNDARCYDTIFSKEYPNTQFISGGGTIDVKKDRRYLAQALRSLGIRAEVIMLVDRDHHSDKEIEDNEKKDVRILRRRNLEEYLLSEEVLRKLAEEKQQAEKGDALVSECESAMTEREQDGGERNWKNIRQRIQQICRRTLDLQYSGEEASAFIRDTLAPLVSPDMEVYRELKEIIFGDGGKE